MRWSRVFPILLLMGAVSLLLSLTLASAQGNFGTVSIMDHGANSDSAVISIPNVATLPDDEVYEGWLVSDDGSRKHSIGVLSATNGGVNTTYIIPMTESSTTFDLDAQNDSGQSGTATITVEDAGAQVELNISAGSTGSELVHIHAGSCDVLGAVVHPLTSFGGGSGGSSTLLTGVALNSLMTGNMAINAHNAADPGVSTSCGNIPMASGTGENLFAAFNQFVVTVEPAADTDPAPSDRVYLAGTIAGNTLDAVRELNYSNAGNPSYSSGFHAGTPKGTAVGLMEQAGLASEYAQMALAAINLGDATAASMHTEAVSAIIEGGSGTSYGDGFGALNYASAASDIAAGAGSAGNDLMASVGTVKASLEHIVNTLSNQAGPALDAGNTTAARAFIHNAANRSSAASDEADQAYMDAQAMGAYTLDAPAPPAVGDPSVPQLALVSLILGTVLLGSGGLIFFRRRNSASVA